ncbi:MAG: thiamine-phosphate kinase [Candidatus Eisenbacteria sp.]|nr:thiamine-phosphate kinase [Candidatus Eisenbacteria bacterium]
MPRGTGTVGDFAAWQEGPPVSQLGEFEVIARIRSKIAGRATSAGSPGAHGAIVQGIGDDASLLRLPPGWDLLWTCDIQMEGCHFLREWMAPREVGARCAEVNLSDIAAMGGQPVAVLVSLGLPAQLRIGALEQIYDGVIDAFARHGAVVAGGNVSKSETLFLDLTVLGRVEEGRALRRSGAKPGDVVFVTGWPGRAAAAVAALGAGKGILNEEGRERLRASYAAPRARVDVGRYLVENGIASAAIDQSDGVVGDLAHICEESGVGIVLEERLLPVDEDLVRLAAALEVDPLSWILGASDDYELLFTVPRAAVDPVFALPVETGVTATPVGEVVDGPQEVLLGAGGGDLRRFKGGWDHLA